MRAELRFKMTPWFGMRVRPRRPAIPPPTARLLGYALTLTSDKDEVVFDPLQVTVNFSGRLTRDGTGVPGEPIGIRVCVEAGGQRECRELPPEETGVVTDGEGNYGFSMDFRLTTHTLFDIDVYVLFQTFTAEAESGWVRIYMPLRYCMGPKISYEYIALVLLGGLAPVLYVSGVVVANEVQKFLAAR